MRYILFGILALASVLLVSCTWEGDSKKTSEKPKNPPVAELVTTPEVLTTWGNYVNYADRFVGVADHTVIFFHADWCGTCHKVEQEILSGDIPDDINILVANYDTEQELKKKYGVTIQTTFVSVDAEWNLIEKWMKWDLATIIKKVSDSSDIPVAQTTQELKTETISVAEAPVEKNDPVVSEVLEESPAGVTGGKYTPYSDALVGTSAHTVIYFHADWCPTCVKLEKNIQAGTIPNDINILVADFDTSKELKKKYGITSQTTLISVTPEGELIKKWVWGDLDTIIEMLEGA